MEASARVAPQPEIIDISEDSEDDGAQDPKQQSPPTTNSLEKSDESDWESDDVEEEADLKPLISPSTDISGDFEALLQHGFDFDGVFSYSQKYAIGDAANPCLNIEGVRAVGLPLSERDASAIISVSMPAAAGIWEISAEKIRFDNPSWATWIQETAGMDALTALTKDSILKPDFKLQKLVIHGENSETTHFKESLDEEESTKIGDLIVILPSVFEGAQLQLHHAGQTKSLNFAHKSGLSTSVVAAYSGVEHTLSGVTSGHRLSLVYEIVQSITDSAEYLCPALPNMLGATQKARNILLSWKQNASDEGTPEFLACLLQHKYPETSNFHAKSLTGADALLVSHLRPIARELKFRLYLAHVEATTSTSAYARDRRRRRPYSGWGTSDDEADMSDIDESDFEDDKDEHDEEFRVIEVVDLDGMPVNVDLNFEASDLLNGSVTDAEHDHESFERDERTTATRTKVYKRTALLIWPKNGDLDLSVTVGDIYSYAFNALKGSVSVTPTKKETKIVNRLLECCRIHRQEDQMKTVIRMLREVADRWNDAQILLRALVACGADKNVYLLGREGFVSAYQAFGWDAIKDFCSQAMKNDHSNTRRWSLLKRLSQMGKDENDAAVSQWCQDQTDAVLHSLGRLDAAQIPWLTSIAVQYGAQLIQQVILPQLATQKLNQAFWIEFVRELKQNIDHIPSPDIVREIIVHSVSFIVGRLPAFPQKTVKPTYRGGETRHESDPARILDVITLCFDTDNAALCARIFKNMHDTARDKLSDKSHYYAALYPAVIEYMQSAPDDAPLEELFRPFFIDVVDSLLFSVCYGYSGSRSHYQSIFMAAARKAGGISLVWEKLKFMLGLKQQDSGTLHTTLQSIAWSIATDFPRKEMQDHADKKTYDELMSAVARRVIDTCNTSALFRASNPSDAMIRLVQFCFSVKAQDQCERLLLSRFTPPPGGSAVKDHVLKVLVPFLAVLRTYLGTRGLTLETEPYKKFAAGIVKAYSESVMSRKPSEVVPIAKLETIGCTSCQECHQLKAFFLSTRAAISFARVQNIRTHLEKILESAIPWGVKVETIRRGSPYTLHITKPDSLGKLGEWVWYSRKGKALLESLGDSAVQARILRADQAQVRARIYGTGPAPAAAPLADASRSVNVLKRPANSAPSGITKKPRTS